MQSRAEQLLAYKCMGNEVYICLYVPCLCCVCVVFVFVFVLCCVCVCVCVCVVVVRTKIV